MKRILERRINRLERILKNEACTSKKCESFESELDETGARIAANRIAQQFGRMLGVSVIPDGPNNVMINSPMFGWLEISDTDEIAEDPDARFAFRYTLSDDDYEIEVYPSDNSVNLINEDGYSVDPSGRLISSDDADIVAFPLRRWKGFDLSMVEDDDDEDYDDDDYYDEAKCRTRRSMNSESARKCGRRMCRRTGR